MKVVFDCITFVFVMCKQAAEELKEQLDRIEIPPSGGYATYPAASCLTLGTLCPSSLNLATCPPYTCTAGCCMHDSLFIADSHSVVTSYWHCVWYTYITTSTRCYYQLSEVSAAHSNTHTNCFAS